VTLPKTFLENEKFWSGNYIKFHNSVAIEEILKKLDIKKRKKTYRNIKKRIEIKRIIRLYKTYSE